MNEVIQSTIPLNSSQMPLVDVKARVGMKERVPMVYDWKHGTVVYPSKRETILLNAWCLTFNYAECCRRYKEETGYTLDPMTCRRWLARPHVKDACMEKMRESARARGYTRDHWMSEGIDMQGGGMKKGFAEVVAWKEMGKACGFYEPDLTSQTNIQINFTERE